MIDGEDLPPSVAPGALDDHLEGCRTCRSWRERAVAVSRAYRLREVPTTRDLSAAVLASRPPAGGTGRETCREPRPARVTVVRLGLVVVAVAQCALAAPALVWGTYRGAPAHVAHELGAFELALAAGFVFAAARPLRSPGVAAVAAVASVGLVATAFAGIATGATTWEMEAPHLVVVAGLVLTGVLTRAISLPPAKEGLRAGAPVAPAGEPSALAAGSGGWHRAPAGGTRRDKPSRTSQEMALGA